MSILKSKIIRNFVNTIYLFGLNASSEVRQIIINYLEKVFNYKLDDETKDILLNDRLSLEEINLFFRKYKYMLLDGDEVGELEEVKKVYEVARESINLFTSLEIKVEDDSISVLKSFETLQEAFSKNLILANSIYGVIYYNGIFKDINVDKANMYFIKNALWNNEFAMLALALNYKEQKDYEKSLYWERMAMKMNFLEECEEYDLPKNVIKKIEKEVEKDYEIHKLLKDDRASSQYNLQTYNPSLSKIIYDKSFNITEKKALLFTQQKMDYSHVSALVCEKKKYELSKIKYSFRADEQERLIKALKVITSKENNYPLIINCESKVIINLYSNFINEYFKNDIVKDLDATRCDYNALLRTYAQNNYLYQIVTQNGSNNIVMKYHNLHEVKDSNLSMFLSLLNPNEKYFIQDLMASVDKSHLINIIFVQNLHSLDSRILQSSNIITLKKETEEEKEEIVRTKFLIELENKGIEYSKEYDKYIDKIASTISFERIFEVINEVVSRVSFETEDVLNEIIVQAKNSRTIGF